MATLGTYYYDSSSFTNATTIYDDADLTTISQNGWYSDNTIVRQQISGVLYAGQVCATPTPVPTPTAPIPVPVPVAPSPVPSPVAPSPVPAPVVVPVAPSPSPVPVPVAPVPTPTAPVPAPTAPPVPAPTAPVPAPTAPTPTPPSSFTIWANSSSGTNPLQGWSSSTAACTGTGVPVTVYNSGGHTTVQQAYSAGNALYVNSALTTLYNGGNTYFKDFNSGGNYFQVGPSGFISTFSACP
jgi:hypothetical protein